MATVSSIRELQTKIRECINGLNVVQRILSDASTLESHLTNGETRSLTQINTAVQNVMNDADTQINEVIDRLNALNFQHQIVVKAGRDSANFDIDDNNPNNGNKTTVAATQGALKTTPYAGDPFSCFNVGDKVRISNAANSANNKDFIVGSKVIDTSQKLVATTVVSGVVDANDDAQLVITLIER